MDEIDTLWRGLIVQGPDGSRYYRHLSRALSSEDQVAAIDETLEFAGDGATVVSIRACTRREHVSGIANCMFGEIPHRH